MQIVLREQVAAIVNIVLIETLFKVNREVIDVDFRLLSSEFFNLKRKGSLLCYGQLSASNTTDDLPAMEI